MLNEIKFKNHHKDFANNHIPAWVREVQWTGVEAAEGCVQGQEAAHCSLVRRLGSAVQQGVH